MLPESFTARTAFGDFRVRIVGGEYINVGGKNDCVQIFYNSLTNSARLDRLETEKGGCSLSKTDIHGEKTIQMTDLAFTILRSLYPGIHEVTLIDSAKFVCILPDGSKTPMSYKQFFLLLKGKTYYQERFNAIPTYSHEAAAVEQFVRNINDPMRKPDIFHFMNKDLNDLLTPIYNESKTWKEFIDKLSNKYKRNVCQVMFPWYLHAYAMIMNSEITTFWKIPIDRRNSIEYEIIDIKESKQYTRKNLVYDPSTFWGGFMYTMPYTIKSDSLSDIRKTRKNKHLKNHMESIFK